MIYKFLILIFICFGLEAHQTGLSFINIKEDTTHNITIVYKKPLSDTRGEDITINYPSKCITKSMEAQIIENGFIINRQTMWCGSIGLKGSRVWIDGLLSKDRGVLIRYEKNEVISKALIRSNTPFIHINSQSGNLELFLEYVSLGMAHIWSGYDHLLFVLSLILLATSMRALLWSITGFTISHSITLAFGVLGIVNIGVAYIEAMIALSIVFLARELLVDKISFTKRYLVVVAFIFGLLHGFGFSSVLRSIGLPQDEIPLSLLAFNLGIEAGQVIFIVVVSSTLLFLKKYIGHYEKLFKKFIAYFIGALSSYWLIERVLNF